MTDRHDQDPGNTEQPLYALVDAARQAEPTALSPARQQAMVRTALSAARADANKRSGMDWRALRVGALASLVTAAVMGGSLWLSARAPAESRALPAPPAADIESSGTETTLPSGDRVTATPDARWTLQSAETRARRVAVEQGVVLFDVQPLDADDSFEVRAGDVRVVVRGTVFSVEHQVGAVVVRVYEGRVHVFDGGRSASVGADEMWRSGDAAGRVSALDSGRLERVGQSAARARERRPPADLDAPERGPLAPDDATAQAPSTDLDGPDDDDVADIARADRPVGGSPGSTASTGAAAEPVPAWGVPGVSRERPRAPRPSLADARSWLAAGHPERALAAASDPHREDPGAPRWQLTRADALRALGRHEQAAAAYDRAARLGVERAESGYTAARIRFGALGDPAGALRSLDAANAESGPLAERVLGLRARALSRLGRHEEARVVATRYLARYPQGGLAPFMRAQLGTGD